MPEKLLFVGYADGDAAPITGRAIEQAQHRLIVAYCQARGWMIAFGFRFAIKKIKVSSLERKSRLYIPMNWEGDYRTKTNC